MDSENTWYDSDPGCALTAATTGDSAVTGAPVPDFGADHDGEFATMTSAAPITPDVREEAPPPVRRAEHTNLATASVPHPAECAAALDLFGRMKAIEDEDGGWNGGDTVDELCQWFREFGIDINADWVAAAQAMRMPPWLAQYVNSQMLDESNLVIHLHSNKLDHTDLISTHLTTLVRALGEGSTAAVYDQPGERIIRIAHADLTLPLH